jgi:putative ABC transport system permease protein
MKLNDAIRSSLRGMRQGKVRTALTMLGIIIGVSSVILIMSLGASAQKYILDQVQSFGSDIISINPGAPTSGPPASAQGIIIKTLNQRDVESLEREPSIVSVAARVSGQARIVYGATSRSLIWHAFPPVGYEMFNMELSSGTVFTESDSQAYNKVIILGANVADDLFGDVDPVGKYVRLKDFNFRVVGVFAPKGAGIFSFDEYAVIPLTVGQKQMLGIDYYHEVATKIDAMYDADFVKERITSILRQNHRITDPSKDDFMVTSVQEALDIITSITSALTVFLSAIAAISLIVGGIGIMNIMLVSVTERTREIGLRKAVGATQRDILTQFLTESVILTSIGGFVGICTGALFTGVAYFGVNRFAGIAWDFQLPPMAVALAVSVSVATGLLFGVYPALKAARKNPIDALRYE